MTGLLNRAFIGAVTLACLGSVARGQSEVNVKDTSKKDTAKSEPGNDSMDAVVSDVLPILPLLRNGFRKTEAAESFQILCGGVYLEKASAKESEQASAGDAAEDAAEDADEFEFKDMELRLLCGDDQGGAIGLPWRQIPPNQAAFFMKSFLQSRGYHQPDFIQDEARLYVRPGPLTRLESFRILGGPEGWRPPKRRLVEKRPLNPSLLNDLEGWSLRQIKNDGYACAEVESRADPETGEAVVLLDPGEVRTIAGIETVGDTGLRSGVLDRYNAFRIGDIYREYLVTLTRQRVMEDGILQSIILSARCQPEGVRLVRDISLGPSRLVRVGIGGSTEAGARLRALVRQNRIGSAASSAQLRGNVSYLNELVNQQVIDASFRWYYARGEERSFLEPLVLYERTEEEAFGIQSTEAQLMHGWGTEFGDGRLDTRVGPTYLDILTTRGPGPDRAQLMIGEVDLNWMSHRFEYFALSPRDGDSLKANLLLTQNNWGASFTAQRLQIRGQKLWNIFRYDPPLLILGVRFGSSSVFSSEEDLMGALPIRFLTFLGGERDLRGFDRQSLPRSGSGSLSSASLSFEVRLHKIILNRVDVFGFVDSGALGTLNFELERPLYMSPGLGLRWESPIGVLRAYAAQGFAVLERDGDSPVGRNWRLGLTFGEEF